jgi:hypothetical protein
LWHSYSTKVPKENSVSQKNVSISILLRKIEMHPNTLLVIEPKEDNHPRLLTRQLSEMASG